MLSEENIAKIRNLVLDSRIEFVHQGVEFLELLAYSIEDIEKIVGETIPEDYDSWKQLVRNDSTKHCYYYIWLLGKLAEYEVPWVLKLGKIELRFLGLTSLPKSLFTLTNIISLDIRNNPIEHLPDNLPALKIDGQQWAQLQKQILQITTLKHLNISKASITVLPEEISQLENLESLFVQGNLLFDLPQSIGQLSQLRVLNASGNRIKKLPESFFHLENLRDVDLSRNALSNFSEQWGELTALTTIKLNGNMLSSIPSTLHQLSQLRTLNLNANRLTEIPDYFGEISSLVNLSLAENRMLRQAPQILTLGNLRRFHINATSLSRIPDLSSCYALEILDFHQLRLLEGGLPMWIGSLPNIRKVNASGIKIPYKEQETVLEWKKRFTIFVDHIKKK